MLETNETKLSIIMDTKNKIWSHLTLREGGILNRAGDSVLPQSVSVRCEFAVSPVGPGILQLS